MTPDDSWAKAYPLPPVGNMMGAHANRERSFVEQGTRMQAAIESSIRAHCERPVEECAILDFGCGNGRIALPFHFKLKKPDAAVDVDEKPLSYLREVLPEVDIRQTGKNPPLPFPAETFDVIYAVSVWTHLSLESGDLWLAEMRCRLKLGGIAIITTHGQIAIPILGRLDFARKVGWGEITEEQLHREGAIFTPQKTFPDGGRYGLTAYDRQWIEQHWTRHLALVEVRPGGIENFQDINVLKKMDSAAA